MKITIVLGAFLPVPPVMGGAVEKVWLALAYEFARGGHEIVLVSRKMQKLPREEIIDGVRHVRVRGFDTPRSLLWLKFLDAIYSVRTMSILPKADLIVTNTFWLPIFLRKATRGKIYVHVARYPKGQMRFYGRAARLQAPSRAVAEAISIEAPKLASKVVVVPNPVPKSASENAPLSIGQREKIILFVGRVHPEKGVHLLIAAFAQDARTLFADWKLMIIGPTEKKHGGAGAPYFATLRRLAEPAHGRVLFCGPIFDAMALECEFRSARLFVYPSLAEKGESFGLAPLEAMAHGCAVLVSNLSCFRDFISDGETGFVFTHRAANPTNRLREKIEKVIVDQTLLARVAEAGYRKSAEYSVERVADRFLADFESVIGNSNAGRTSR
jgi:glycosyltransferase involved in cell wall biosynthesis